MWKGAERKVRHHTLRADELDRQGKHARAAYERVQAEKWERRRDELDDGRWRSEDGTAESPLWSGSSLFSESYPTRSSSLDPLLTSQLRWRPVGRVNWREALEAAWHDGLEARSETLFDQPEAARAFATAYALMVLIHVGQVTPKQADEYARTVGEAARELRRLIEPN